MPALLPSVGLHRLFRLPRLGQEQSHHQMGIGLIGMAGHESVEPAFYLSNVVRLLERERVAAPGFSKLPL